MLNHYNTIWIDVTDLAEWRGHLNGMQRAEYSLALRFSQLDNVRFFVFKDPVFCVADFDVVRSHIEAEIKRGNNKQVPPPAPERSPARRRAKKVAGRLIQAAPLVSPEVAVDMYDKSAHQIKHLVGLAQSAGKGRRTSSPGTTRFLVVEEGNATPEEAVFDRGDLVLVLSGNWLVNNYIQQLGRSIRRADGITFGHIIYDLVRALQPGFFPRNIVERFQQYIKTVLEDANICFTTSEHSREDIVSYARELGITAPELHTIRLGGDHTSAAPIKPKKLKISSSEPFVFSPGTIEVRKNHQVLYHGYRLAAEKGLDLPHLVIGGKQGWLSDDILYQFKNDPVVNRQITVLTSCVDTEFSWLYQNASFMVYPSLYEGWGLPVAESLRYHKMCLAARSTSIPEVAGDLIEYFAADASSEVAELIHKYASDPELLRAKELEIASRYKPVAWDDTFRDVATAVASLRHHQKTA